MPPALPLQSARLLWGPTYAWKGTSNLCCALQLVSLVAVCLTSATRPLPPFAWPTPALPTGNLMAAVKGQLQAAVAAISNEDTLQLLELLDVLCSSADGAAAATTAGVLPLLLQSLPMGRSMGSLMGSMSVKLLLVLMRTPGGMQAAQEAGTAQQLSDALQVRYWASRCRPSI